jgi:mortality factor 4-like protein 1
VCGYSEKAELNTGVLSALQLFFDESVGSLLLYRFERPQYKQIIESEGAEKALSQIYGPHHLLRLFCKISLLVLHIIYNDY